MAQQNNAAPSTGFWLQPPSLAVAPSSPGPADQLRMILGVGNGSGDIETSEPKLHQDQGRNGIPTTGIWN